MNTEVVGPIPDYAKMDAPAYFVPCHLREGIKRYIDQHIEPGDFLCAVIENDLRESAGLADYLSTCHLPTIVAWFYQYAPAACWGSHGKLLAWLEEG